MSDGNCEKKTRLRGVLHFWSETGTEGGYWAFQDESFITRNTTKFYCTKCYKFWDKGLHPDGPPTAEKSAIVVTRVVPLDKVTDCSGKLPPECRPNEHVFEPTSEHIWSYEGLHILEDGDKIVVFIQEGVRYCYKISLRQYPAFQESVFGLWIRADQIGVDRETWARWFLDGLPAELIPAKPK